MPGVIARGLLGAEPDIDPDARRTQPRMTLARHVRIGIFNRRDDARDARSDDRIRARRRLAEM